MLFNPDVNKQDHEVVFSRKQVYTLPPPQIIFNNSPVVGSSFQTHIGVYLDTKFDFIHHVNLIWPGGKGY